MENRCSDVRLHRRDRAQELRISLFVAALRGMALASWAEWVEAVGTTWSVVGAPGQYSRNHPYSHPADVAWAEPSMCAIRAHVRHTSLCHPGIPTRSLAIRP